MSTISTSALSPNLHNISDMRNLPKAEDGQQKVTFSTFDIDGSRWSIHCGSGWPS
jgi:hypothetical protein